MSNKDIATALKASTRSSSWGRKVVGRLLSPIELDEVAGGGGSCNDSVVLVFKGCGSSIYGFQHDFSFQC